MTCTRPIDHLIANLARAAIIDRTDPIDARSTIAEFCDDIIASADAIDDLELETIMMLARMIDPTESDLAAAIRDTIRDNTDHRLA